MGHLAHCKRMEYRQLYKHARACAQRNEIPRYLSILRSQLSSNYLLACRGRLSNLRLSNAHPAILNLLIFLPGKRSLVVSILRQLDKTSWTYGMVSNSTIAKL